MVKERKNEMNLLLISTSTLFFLQKQRREKTGDKGTLFRLEKMETNVLIF